MIYSSDLIEKEAVFEVAKLMAAAARTAPKARGIDNILTMIVDGDEKERLADEMTRLAEEGTYAAFSRDAGNVRASDYVVLLAVKDNHSGVPHCGVCGFENCDAAKAAGSPCAINVSDLGTAASSACIVASNHFVDNRLMYTAGRAAQFLGFFGTEIRLCYGIPVSATGKSLYFDR